MGILDIMNGNYQSAIQNMQGYNTYNKALAQLLAGNSETALNTLNQSDDKDTAEGQYLKAIIGARRKHGFQQPVGSIRTGCFFERKSS